MAITETRGMLAIHSIWADGVLLLWAEDATRPAPAAAVQAESAPGPPHPGAARAEASKARQHLGEASPAALAAALAGLPGEAAELAWSGTASELVLWLPSTASGPQPSP